jgi:hypothetical protein
MHAKLYVHDHAESPSPSAARSALAFLALLLGLLGSVATPPLFVWALTSYGLR